MSFGMIICETEIEEKVKLCYMDTKSFNICVNTGNIYKDTAKDVEARFDTPNYE